MYTDDQIQIRNEMYKLQFKMLYCEEKKIKQIILAKHIVSLCLEKKNFDENLMQYQTSTKKIQQKVEIQTIFNI